MSRTDSSQTAFWWSSCCRRSLRKVFLCVPVQPDTWLTHWSRTGGAVSIAAGAVTLTALARCGGDAPPSAALQSGRRRFRRCRPPGRVHLVSSPSVGRTLRRRRRRHRQSRLLKVAVMIFGLIKGSVYSCFCNSCSTPAIAARGETAGLGRVCLCAGVTLEKGWRVGWAVWALVGAAVWCGSAGFNTIG